jgi:hypothetical protein
VPVQPVLPVLPVLPVSPALNVTERVTTVHVLQGWPLLGQQDASQCCESESMMGIIMIITGSQQYCTAVQQY